jgi:hypothetical protein
VEKISLAGCNVGLIPKLLQQKLTIKDKPEIGWVLPIADILKNKGQTVIIDIKPKSKTEIFLCELDSVYGFSYNEWTPIMYRLKVLVNKRSPKKTSKKIIVYPPKPDIIYTILYMMGSFKKGRLTGKWTGPAFGSANSLLLWPDAASFFYQQIKKNNPEFINENIQLIKF